MDVSILSSNTMILSLKLMLNETVLSANYLKWNCLLDDVD